MRFETLAVVADTSGINLGDHQILRLARDEDIDAAGELLADGNWLDARRQGDRSRRRDPKGGGRAHRGHRRVVHSGGRGRTRASRRRRAGDVRSRPCSRTDRVLRGQHHRCRLSRRRRRGSAGVSGRCPARRVRLRRSREPWRRERRRADRRSRRPGDGPACRRRRPRPTRTGRRDATALAFVRPGCQFASAELWATRSTLTAHFEQEDPDIVIDCGQAEYYLAVFDVPAEAVPPDAELDGSIVS